MSYTEEQKQEARNRFFQGETIPEIAVALNIERRTLYNWRNAESWMIARPDDPEILIRQRITLLTGRENKTELEIHELFGLVDKLLAFEKLRNRYQDRKAAEPGETGGAGGSGRARSGGSKKRGPKNDFRDIDETELLEQFRDGLFEYQIDLWEHRTERIRNILKSRQIGATWYFSREAFADALLTGKNKVFVSASRAQADYFRGYICAFAREWFDMELAGKDKIELHTPHGVATLYFLSTNSATAQGAHGDLYVDEYFWIPNFEKLASVTRPIASHKEWRMTYFSTPSAKSHSAYPFWSGDKFNESRKEANQPLVEFPDRDTLRRGGVRCPDGQWREIITLDDAIRRGCTCFDKETLLLEYTPEEYRNFFDCYFFDDTNSVFKLAELEKCLVDPADAWHDIKPGLRYAGPVWVGYDPSRTRDGASIIVMAAPLTPGGKFRVLEKINMRDVAWQAQADRIKTITEQYNVRYIGIDVTGNGSGVFEMVKVFYPAATAIFYSIEQKTQLVLKAQQIISQGRIEWPAEYSSIAAGFMQIHRCITGNGQITYAANRTDKTGHADDAWAVMHALMKEGLVPKYMRRRGTVVIG